MTDVIRTFELNKSNRSHSSVKMPKQGRFFLRSTRNPKFYDHYKVSKDIDRNEIEHAHSPHIAKRSIVGPVVSEPIMPFKRSIFNSFSIF